MFNLNQYAREAGDAVRQAVGVEPEPHKSASAQKRLSVYHSLSPLLVLATVLLTLFSSVTVWKYLSLSLFFFPPPPCQYGS